MIGSKVLKVAALTWCVSIIAACGVKASVDQGDNAAQEDKRPNVATARGFPTKQKPSIFTPEFVAKNIKLDQEKIKKSLEFARANAVPVDTDAIREADKMPVGNELQICDGCPIFVRVPSPPDDLRPVQYVSKYELTWNNYLAAVDAGACPPPDFHGSGPFHYEGDIAEHLDAFRLDWPINQLNLAKIKCYMEWLNIKSGRQFALPTADEWKWFARAGEPDIKFPWGNDPEDGNAAFVANNRIKPQRYDADPYANIELAKRIGIGVSKLPYLRRAHIAGAKVGQYTPNKWGLYDLMGNYRELTSSHGKVDKFRPNHDTYKIMGTTFYDHRWQEHTIDRYRFITNLGLRFTASTATRFIIISEGE